jgi:hypothetical protein
MHSIRSTHFVALACFVALGIHTQAGATAVTLQNATATFSQYNPSIGWDFTVDKAINGTVADNLGWSIAIHNQVGSITNQTAVFETATDIGFTSGSTLTFTLYQTHGIDFATHTLGRFRLSATTDNRALFADGLISDGDVTANWVVLDPDSYVSAAGATLTKLGDLSILASGISPDTDVYTIAATTSLTGITGIRLEAIEDPSLPFDGPGRQPINGNFCLSELELSITQVPEPSAVALALAGFLVCVATSRKPRS